eukprot:3385039-Amphidinium_carterae.1
MSLTCAVFQAPRAAAKLVALECLEHSTSLSFVWAACEASMIHLLAMLLKKDRSCVCLSLLASGAEGGNGSASYR